MPRGNAISGRGKRDQDKVGSEGLRPAESPNFEKEAPMVLALFTCLRREPYAVVPRVSDQYQRE